ncbi:acyltransferase ChoActase/COT/CPT [Zopfochytrium polystomum]|nr:acyltransferase ChoActase/COT/CPT [Zopfochytrium polystomum]
MTSPPYTTFSRQRDLQRLPIPPLADTLATYLRSVRAATSSNEEYAAAAAAVRAFSEGPDAIGPVLQKRLAAHDRLQPNSWLERWWLRLAYHGWRESVLINSNWYMIVDPHPELDQSLLVEGAPARARNGIFTKSQLQYAAGIISRFLDYKDLIDSGSLPVEMSRGKPVCMDQSRLMFGITRVPKPGCDVNVGQHPAHSRHVIVMARDQIYAVNVLDKSGARLTLAAIEKQLQAVVDDVLAAKDVQPAVAILTAEHRDVWAEVHAHMEKLSPHNERSFDVIERGLFAVSLDDYFVPLTKTALGRNTFHGVDGRNRWYDKSLTWTISADGRSGVNGEHSPCDAVVPARVIDFAARPEPFKNPASAKVDAEVEPPFKVTWVVDKHVEEAITRAGAFAKKLIADSDVEVLDYKGYGADFMKKAAKASPDAYTQMALQLTYFRLHKMRPPVYESASTRQFLHGRTETTRSLSVESVNFIESFDNPSISPSDKLEKLRQACSAHMSYSTKAANGLGCDRHLLGLRMCLKPGESAAIYTDPMYAKSQTWRLSTSALFQGVALAGTGFGAVVPDGYGMNYVPYPNLIRMGVESKVSCDATSTAKFSKMFATTLDDMKFMVEAAIASGKSKL